MTQRFPRFISTQLQPSTMICMAPPECLFFPGAKCKRKLMNHSPRKTRRHLMPKRADGTRLRLKHSWNTRTYVPQIAVEVRSLIIFLTLWNEYGCLLRQQWRVSIRERKKGRWKTLPEKRSRQIWPKEQSCQYVQVHIINPSKWSDGWMIINTHKLWKGTFHWCLVYLFFPTTEFLLIM